MNLPNKLTVLRIILIPFFVLALLLPVGGAWLHYTALAIFLIASFTDYLDGHIARKYHLVTNFGKFMDPLADKMLVASALICLVEIGLLPAWAVILLIGRDFIISGFRLIAAERGLVIAAGPLGKIKTVLQMLLIILLLAWPHVTIFSNILLGVTILFTVWSLADYLYANRQILKDGDKK